MNAIAEITVCTKPSCVQCNATYRALDAAGIEYEIRDLTLDPSALEQVKALGHLQAPVIITGEGDHWAGFRPDKIADLEAEKAQLQADVDHRERETNHWYMKATYTDLELQLIYRRRSRGADELTGEWQPATAQHSAVA